MTTTPAAIAEPITFTVPGDPRPKARPRYTTRAGKVVAYTPQDTVHAEQRIAWAFQAAAGNSYRLPDDDGFKVDCTFYVSSQHRRDVDNLMKAVLDGLNKVAWRDDVLVTELVGRKVLTSKEEARTEVTVTNLGPRERRRNDCVVCGASFIVYKSTEDRAKYCSQECWHSTLSSRKVRVCPQCGKEFTWQGASRASVHCSTECGYNARRQVVPCSRCGKTFSKQKCHVRTNNYCSTECRRLMEAEKAKQYRSKSKGLCTVCGGPVSKPQYKRCNPCKFRGETPSGNPITLTEETS